MVHAQNLNLDRLFQAELANLAKTKLSTQPEQPQMRTNIKPAMTPNSGADKHISDVFTNCRKILRNLKINSYQVKNKPLHNKRYLLKVDNNGLELQEGSVQGTQTIICDFSANEVYLNKELMPANFLQEVSAKLRKIVQDIHSQKAEVKLKAV